MSLQTTTNRQIRNLQKRYTKFETHLSVTGGNHPTTCRHDANNLRWVLRDATPCSLVGMHQSFWKTCYQAGHNIEHGGSRLLQNAGILLQSHMMLRPADNAKSWKNVHWKYSTNLAHLNLVAPTLHSFTEIKWDKICIWCGEEELNIQSRL